MVTGLASLVPEHSFACVLLATAAAGATALAAGTVLAVGRPAGRIAAEKIWLFVQLAEMVPLAHGVATVSLHGVWVGQQLEELVAEASAEVAVCAAAAESAGYAGAIVAASGAAAAAARAAAVRAAARAAESASAPSLVLTAPPLLDWWLGNDLSLP